MRMITFTLLFSFQFIFAETCFDSDPIADDLREVAAKDFASRIQDILDNESLDIQVDLNSAKDVIKKTKSSFERGAESFVGSLISVGDFALGGEMRIGSYGSEGSVKRYTKVKTINGTKLIVEYSNNAKDLTSSWSDEKSFNKDFGYYRKKFNAVGDLESCNFESLSYGYVSLKNKKTGVYIFKGAEIPSEVLREFDAN